MDLAILKTFPDGGRARAYPFKQKSSSPSPCRQGKSSLQPLEYGLCDLNDGMKLRSNFTTRKGGMVRETESSGLPSQTGQAFGLTLFAGGRCERR
jgi:hypothetical protein